MRSVACLEKNSESHLNASDRHPGREIPHRGIRPRCRSFTRPMPAEPVKCQPIGTVTCRRRRGQVVIVRMDGPVSTAKRFVIVLIGKLVLPCGRIDALFKTDKYDSQLLCKTAALSNRGLKT